MSSHVTDQISCPLCSTLQQHVNSAAGTVVAHNAFLKPITNPCPQVIGGQHRTPTLRYTLLLCKDTSHLLWSLSRYELHVLHCYAVWISVYYLYNISVIGWQVVGKWTRISILQCPNGFHQAQPVGPAPLCHRHLTGRNTIVAYTGHFLCPLNRPINLIR